MSKERELESNNSSISQATRQPSTLRNEPLG